MKAQFKYALRQSLELKATAFAALVLMNLVFGILGYFKLWGEAGMITAVTLSSIAFVGIIAIRAIVDGRYFKDIFGTPDGYLYALTPVKSWKIMLARSITMIAEDCLSLFVGIIGIVWQASVLSGDIGFGVNSGSNWRLSATDIRYIIFGTIILLLGYAYLTMLGMFGTSLRNSVFFGIRGRALLASLSVIAVMWVFNLLNFVFAPFGEVTRWKCFFSIILPGGFYTGFAVYFMLLSVKTAALFFAGSILRERKNNL